jgi:arylsulfatase A-like enzyme
VHYTAPHWPWETRADEAEARRIEKIFHFDGGSVETYLTMVRQMDEGSAASSRASRMPGSSATRSWSSPATTVASAFSDTWPLVGKKMDLLEGGIRVPYIVRWPARVRAGGTTAQPALTMDWTATFLEAADVRANPSHPLDGVSLLPTLARPEPRSSANSSGA